jgi:acetyltransferase-like isoleucine patch superfamily enzyme
MREGVALSHDWFPEPLPGNVIIGHRSWVYSSFAFRHYRSNRPCGVRIGNDSGIYNGTFFDLGPDGELEIGDFTTLVGAIVRTNRKVVIGDYVFISHEVVMSDSDFPCPEIFRDAPDRPGPGAVLGDNCWVGAKAVLLSGARIGEGAIVGAGAVVASDVPPFAIVAGNPAAVVGWCNRGAD